MIGIQRNQRQRCLVIHRPDFCIGGSLTHEPPLSIQASCRGFANQLREELELVDGVYPEFDVETYRSADVAPVFFGSALNISGCCIRITIAADRRILDIAN